MLARVQAVVMVRGRDGQAVASDSELRLTPSSTARALNRLLRHRPGRETLRGDTQV